MDGMPERLCHSSYCKATEAGISLATQNDKQERRAMATLPATLRTGVDLIDREHERLLELESRLTQFCTKAGEPCGTCDISRQSECDKTLSQLFAELLGFMAEHFQHEERLMIDLPTEISSAHKFEHAEISARFASLVRRNERKTMLATPGELSEIVTHWLGRHIECWDIPLADHIGGNSGNG